MEWFRKLSQFNCAKYALKIKLNTALLLVDMFAYVKIIHHKLFALFAKEMEKL